MSRVMSMVRLNGSLTMRQFDMIRSEAQRLGVTMPEALRRILDEHMDVCNLHGNGLTTDAAVGYYTKSVDH